MKIADMFEECAAARYPGLNRESRQWRELKAMFYYGAMAAGAIQNDALASASTSTGFDVDAMFRKTIEMKADIDEYLNPRVVAPPKPELIV